jgi:hypothetical protein
MRSPCHTAAYRQPRAGRLWRSWPSSIVANPPSARSRSTWRAHSSMKAQNRTNRGPWSRGPRPGPTRRHTRHRHRRCGCSCANSPAGHIRSMDSARKNESRADSSEQAVDAGPPEAQDRTIRVLGITHQNVTQRSSELYALATVSAAVATLAPLWDLLGTLTHRYSSRIRLMNSTDSARGIASPITVLKSTPALKTASWVSIN